MIFRFFVLATCASVALIGSAHSREPVLSWSIQRVDAAGTVLPQVVSQTSLDAANNQARTFCDPAYIARFKWPTPSAVLVTVRPVGAAPEDPRKRSATVPCADYASNPNALESHIPRPQSKPIPDKKMIQLWD